MKAMAQITVWDPGEQPGERTYVITVSDETTGKTALLLAKEVRKAVIRLAKGSLTNENR